MTKFGDVKFVDSVDSNAAFFSGRDRRRGRCSIGEHPDDLRQITVVGHQEFSDDLICKLEFK